ncbi:MAG TPA: Crp/Fnr family transcriptional regulator [Gemmatimonadaceae bacterium]|nr:Crp/Fnr family transcriptional regulator [Gemmatimonadaceae bacterium]
MSISEILPRNAILASLPTADLNRIRPYITSRSLVRGAVLHVPEAPVETLYFIERGLVTLEVPLDQVKFVERASVAHDGVTGASAFLGTRASVDRAVVRVAGMAYGISASVLADVVVDCSAMRRALGDYVSRLDGQTARNLACMSRHSSEQRLARWLLTASRHGDAGAITTTHADLASLLGVRRSTVSVLAARWRRTGVINSTRTKLSVRDAEALGRLTCMCTQGDIAESPAATI